MKSTPKHKTAGTAVEAMHGKLHDKIKRERNVGRFCGATLLPAYGGIDVFSQPGAHYSSKESRSRNSSSVRLL